jgi:hypothetical protein
MPTTSQERRNISFDLSAEAGEIFDSMQHKQDITDAELLRRSLAYYVYLQNNLAKPDDAIVIFRKTREGQAEIVKGLSI